MLPVVGPFVSLVMMKLLWLSLQIAVTFAMGANSMSTLGCSTPAWSLSVTFAFVAMAGAGGNFF
ncbi:MAG: hypothetical protein IJ702_01930 [Fretibacterium sp.]|nr:hypothetical protein [Fretibacterium sp.]